MTPEAPFQNVPSHISIGDSSEIRPPRNLKGAYFSIKFELVWKTYLFGIFISFKWMYRATTSNASLLNECILMYSLPGTLVRQPNITGETSWRTSSKNSARSRRHLNNPSLEIQTPASQLLSHCGGFFFTPATSYCEQRNTRNATWWADKCVKRRICNKQQPMLRLACLHVRAWVVSTCENGEFFSRSLLSDWEAESRFCPMKRCPCQITGLTDQVADKRDF